MCLMNYLLIRWLWKVDIQFRIVEILWKLWQFLQKILYEKSNSMFITKYKMFLNVNVYNQDLNLKPFQLLLFFYKFCIDVRSDQE